MSKSHMDVTPCYIDVCYNAIIEKDPMQKGGKSPMPKWKPCQKGPHAKRPLAYRVLAFVAAALIVAPLLLALFLAP